MRKYRVTTGIFKDHVFNGTPQTIDGEERIWDNDTIGRSYPAENCKPEPVNYDLFYNGQRLASNVPYAICNAQKYGLLKSQPKNYQKRLFVIQPHKN